MTSAAGQHLLLSGLPFQAALLVNQSYPQITQCPRLFYGCMLKADLEEATLEHHAAEELQQVDDCSLQLCSCFRVQRLLQQS